jgi:hypothetical protein
MSNQTNTMIENEVIETEAAMAQIAAFDDLSVEDLEARISKDNGGASGNFWC